MNAIVRFMGGCGYKWRSGAPCRHVCKFSGRHSGLHVCRKCSCRHA